MRAKRNTTEGRLRPGKSYPSTWRWAQGRKLVADRKGKGERRASTILNSF